MGVAHAAWVGKRWMSSSMRLLLLGESHYLTDLADDSTELTRQIITGVRDGTRRIRFYTRTEAVCVGVPFAETDEPTSFWDRVAFSNFVPMTVGMASDAVPTAEMWRAGSEYFTRLLDELRPSHVLSLGQRQWNQIRLPADWGSSTSREDPAVRLWNTPKGEHIRATWINHPSSRGFNAHQWTPRVSALFAG